jgi:hypothetical protein
LIDSDLGFLDVLPVFHQVSFQELVNFRQQVDVAIFKVISLVEEVFSQLYLTHLFFKVEVW